MTIDESLLTDEEALSLSLRALYRQSGYRRYVMSKFEAYDLYAQFRDFLGSEAIISFTDTNGRLMALKPDVTLFYAANCAVGSGEVSRIWYDEKVYRVSKTTGSFKEIMQVGVECLGALERADVNQVIVLAARSLAVISSDTMLALSSLDILSEALDSLGLTTQQRARAQQYMAERNAHELVRLSREAGATDEATSRLLALLRLPADIADALDRLRELGFSASLIDELASAVQALQNAGFAQMSCIDFSLVNDTAYYNGLVFQGFAAGVPRAVIMGGQYDNLLVKLGRNLRAVGFAVYMDGLRSVHDANA